MSELHSSTSWINVTAWTFKREAGYSVKKDHLPTKYSITEPNCYWLQPGIGLRVVSLFLEIEWGECMCALEATKCERRWRQAKKKPALLVFSLFFCLCHLMPSVTHIIIFVSCVFPLTSWEKRETARNLAWYLCAHHSQHYDLVLRQMKHNQNSSSLQRSHSC